MHILIYLYAYIYIYNHNVSRPHRPGSCLTSFLATLAEAVGPWRPEKHPCRPTCASSQIEWVDMRAIDWILLPYWHTGDFGHATTGLSIVTLLKKMEQPKQASTFFSSKIDFFIYPTVQSLVRDLWKIRYLSACTIVHWHGRDVLVCILRPDNIIIQVSKFPFVWLNTGKSGWRKMRNH